MSDFSQIKVTIIFNPHDHQKLCCATKRFIEAVGLSPKHRHVLRRMKKWDSIRLRLFHRDGKQIKIVK
jgi:hypothetical protein